MKTWYVKLIREIFVLKNWQDAGRSCFCQGQCPASEGDFGGSADAQSVY